MPLTALFRDLLPREAIQENVLLCSYTTMRVGGPADVMLSPSTEEELTAVLDCIQRETIPWLIIGNVRRRLSGRCFAHRQKLWQNIL